MVNSREPFTRFNPLDIETVLVRVKTVNSQNDWGAIFDCDLIDMDGNLIEFQGDYFQIRALRKHLSTTVKPGQWWSITGRKQYTEYTDVIGVIRCGTVVEVETNGAEMVMPSGRAIVDYIAAHPDMTGVGESKALKLWEAWQEKLFDLLDSSDVDTLSTVVTRDMAERIVQAWQEDGLGYQLQWLQSHDVPYRVGKKALDYFGRDMVHTVTNNPYVLLPFSASWRAIDTLAIEVIGIAKDDPRRLEAAVHEACYRRISKGHTFVQRKWLISTLKNSTNGLLNNITEDIDSTIMEALRLAHESGRLFFDSKGHAYPAGACVLENNVVEAVKSRLSVHCEKTDTTLFVKRFEKQEGYKLNPEQKQAIQMVVDNNCCVITGGAGVGKTTVLQVVYSALESQGYEIIQLAIAGKAAKRIAESTGRPANTIAKFIFEQIKDGCVEGEHQDNAKMAVIIDEASMVDILSMNKLLDYLPRDCKLILVGDPNQLPPVGPGLILHVLADFEKIPHTKLVTTNRFGGEILRVAESILRSEFPSEFKDSVSFSETGEHNIAEASGQLYLEGKGDQIILCARKKEVGYINKYVQERLTKKGKELTIYNDELGVDEGFRLYLNDPVICTRNRYDWGLQNGSVGRIVEIFDAPKMLESDEGTEQPALGWIVWDDFEKRPLRENLLDDLSLCYAMTIHKSQGSQWDHVILALATPSGKKLARNSITDRALIYTGLTRAKQKVSIFGNHEHLSQAVCQNNAIMRDTALAQRLQSKFLLYDTL